MNIDLTKLTPKVRMLHDLDSVAADQEWIKNAAQSELYYMYGDVAQNKDLWYSITVIPGKMLGNEFVKTKGHTHIGAFQETYTVLEGQAIYLFQKTNGPVVEDVYAVIAQKGQSVIIPSNYGHVSINPSSEELKTGDWRFEGIKADYSLFEKLQGACYYFIAKQSQTHADLTQTSADAPQGIWVKNNHYQNIPSLRFEEPLKEVPANLDFLKAK